MSKFHKIEKIFSFDSFECLQNKGLSRKIYFVPAKFMERLQTMIEIIQCKRNLTIDSKIKSELLYSKYSNQSQIESNAIAISAKCSKIMIGEWKDRSNFFEFQYRYVCLSFLHEKVNYFGGIHFLLLKTSKMYSWASFMLEK